jgi:adenosylcobinamide-GDP ribazoletransferase
MLRSFLAAVQFLTRIPVPHHGPLDEHEQARSALFYPVVGLLIGLGLWAGARLLGATPTMVSAAALLLVWVWATGGLHLDGLSDTADAWVGGLGDRERTLRIMKDQSIGTMGALALILVLIAKWAGLASLAKQDAEVLLWLPALARTQLLLLFLTTAYAGRGGIGGDIAAVLPRRPAWAVSVSIWGACLLVLGSGAWVPVLATFLTFVIWRRAMVNRLGGFTGDTAGALVELTETFALLSFAACCR